MAMLHTKFQAPKPSGSEEEDFEVYFVFEPKTLPPQGHFGPQGHHLNKFGKGPPWQCYIPNIKALGLAVSEEMLFKAIVDDGRRTTDDGHWPMTIAHPEPMAQVS